MKVLESLSKNESLSIKRCQKTTKINFLVLLKLISSAEIFHPLDISGVLYKTVQKRGSRAIALHIELLILKLI